MKPPFETTPELTTPAQHVLFAAMPELITQPV